MTTRTTRTTRTERAETGLLVPIAIGVAVLLSIAFALAGMMIFGLSAMCYDAGRSAKADACVANAWTTVGACVATLAIPIAIGLWAGRARSTSQAVGRIIACFACYLIPVLLFFAPALS